MRIRTAFSLAVLLCVALAPTAAASVSSTADTTMATLTMAPAQRREPSPRVPLHPLSYLGLAAMGVTTSKNKKRPTRRATGAKSPDVPMYLDTEAHVMRDDELVKIPGGVLVEDTELDDDEIEEFLARGVIRPATPEEIVRLHTAGAREAAKQLADEQGREMQQLLANQAAELAVAAETDKAKLAEKHLKAVSALQQKHAQAAAS